MGASRLIVPPIEADGEQLPPTLGPEVCDWIEAHLCHGPGDLLGEPVRLTEELRLLIWRAYELYPKGHELEGRRRFKRVVLSRRKGVGKTELAAWLAIAEMDPTAPVRFDGWHMLDGEWVPVGRPVRDPYIPMVAVTEEQTEDLAYGAVYAILAESALANDYDIGLERIVHKQAAGKIQPMASAPSARDGARTTFQHFDEAVAITTPIPTPTGWTTMGELQVGDEILGTDGLPCTVIGKSDVHVGRPCYRVTFADGTWVVTDEDHLWWARRRGGCGHGRGCRCDVRPGWAIRRTGDMGDAVFDAGARLAFRYHVEQPSALKLNGRNLPVDPYLLGLWLGDGVCGSQQIAVGAHDREEIQTLIEATGVSVSLRSRRKDLLSVLGLKAGLRVAGVLHHKRMPEEYLRSSLDQRLALVQGLMDSDGHATAGGWCTFVNTNRQLVAGIAELLRTLGFAPSIHWREDEREVRYKCVGRVGFQGHQGMPTFRLSRKMARLPERRTARHELRAISRVEPVPSVPVQCIAVDSPDRLFLVGEGFVPTHNTHLFVSARLKNAHSTMLRNIAKRRGSDPWTLETTTAYAPGEDSIAEDAHRYALDVFEGRTKDSARILFDHRQAADKHRLTVRSIRRSAIREASGDAWPWADVEAIDDQWSDPRVAEEEFRRYWLNQPQKTRRKWIDVGRSWDTLAKRKRIAAGARVVLAFDGSYARDSTALIGCTVGTRPHLFVVKVWERPVNDPAWRTPRLDVEDTLAAAMKRYRVLELAPDPPGWHSEVEEWEEAYGEVVVRFETNQPRRMGPACDDFFQAVHDERVTHDGSRVLRRHLANCVPVQRRTYTVVVKSAPDSPDKIDAAVGAIVALHRAMWHAGQTEKEPLIAWG